MEYILQIRINAKHEKYKSLGRIYLQNILKELIQSLQKEGQCFRNGTVMLYNSFTDVYNHCKREADREHTLS